MDVTADNARRFPSFSKCIYCGAGGRLTREHIYPAGLGGGLILPDASCEICQRIIHGVETTCMRKTLLPYRQAIGLVREKKDLPATVPLTLDLELSGPKKVALDDHPKVVVLPGLRDLPGILTGTPPASIVQFEYKIFCEAPEIAVTLAGEPVRLRFVQVHFDDLKAIFAEGGSEQFSSSA